MKKLMIKHLVTFSFLVVSFVGYTQDMLTKLEKEYPIKPIYELATFKTTRIGLGHSIEMRKKGALEISLFNRFWNREDDSRKRVVPDEVSLRFGLNYAITDNFTIGGGYTNFDGITDGFIKYKILRQQKNTSKAPVSIVFFQGVSNRNKVDFESNLYAEDEIINSNVYSFVSQALIAKKFNQNFSIQLTPTFIHRDKSIFIDQPKNQFAVGLGARYKLGGHISLVSEYYYTINPVSANNPFMIGVNWELSHLLLQFQMTNTRSFVEDAFITQTQNTFNFADGNFHFGFNAIFVLHAKKNKL
jgi:opacity protein-like surface antigen